VTSCVTFCRIIYW